jgi:uncharacterized protein YodC (DUF2158 family)
MAKVNLHLGNVVKLRSGGPAMTVEREPDRAEDAVHCVWSDSGHIQRDKFPRLTLDKVKT